MKREKKDFFFWLNLVSVAAVVCDAGADLEKRGKGDSRTETTSSVHQHSGTKWRAVLTFVIDAPANPAKAKIPPSMPSFMKLAPLCPSPCRY